MIIAALVVAWFAVGGAFIIALSTPTFKPLTKQ